MLVIALAGAVLLGAPDTVESPTAGPRDVPVGIVVAADSAQQGKRRRSLELSDAYNTRLKIHQIASYATLPLFVTQYFAGQALFNADTKGLPRPDWARAVHRPVAYALGGLFLVNSVTGALNWWETRGEEQGRAWRTTHALLMLASDAGFAYVGTLGPKAKTSFVDRDTHRRWAIGTSVVALASYAMMLDPIRRDK